MKIILFLICNTIITCLGIVSGVYLVVKNHLIIGTVIVLFSLLLFSGIKLTTRE